MPKIMTRPITSEDWTTFERLFGKNGACGGCWCMLWRVPRGGKLWASSKGEPNRRAFRKLVRTGTAKGCLAFVGDEAVGWCSVAPRGDFPRLATVKALQTDWDERTWCVTCFYIPARWRNQGVATALLKQAVKLARSGGAKTLEGYPVRPSKSSKGPIPPVFAWTGVNALFEKQKFVKLTTPLDTRDVFVRKWN